MNLYHKFLRIFLGDYNGEVKFIYLNDWTCIKFDIYTGLFMALQPKIIDCGAKLTAFAILLRFVVAPTMMAIGSLIVGLRGDFLCIAIIQVITK